MCVSIYNICVMNIWQGYKSPPTLGCLAAGSGGQLSTRPWPCLATSGCVCLILDSLTVPDPALPPTGWCSSLDLAYSHPQGGAWCSGQGLPPAAPHACPAPGWGLVVGWAMAVRSCPAALGELPWPPAPKSSQPSLKPDSGPVRKNSKNREWVGIRIE